MRFAVELELELFYLELELCWSTGRAVVRVQAAKPRGVRVGDGLGGRYVVYKVMLESE